MTSYSVTTVGEPVALAANLYEIRFTGAIITNNSSAAPYVALVQYSSGTVSGGTATTPTILHDGGPACSAAAYYGPSMTYTGTKHVLYEYSVGTGTASSSGPGATIQSAPTVGNQDAILPITARPGDVLNLWLGTDLSPNGVLTMFFEEIRLPGSY